MQVDQSCASSRVSSKLAKVERHDSFESYVKPDTAAGSCAGSARASVSGWREGTQNTVISDNSKLTEASEIDKKLDE